MEPIARPRRRPRIALVRGLSLLLFVGCLAGVGGLLLFGRAGRPEPVVQAETVPDLGEGYLLSGRGFDYSATVGEQTLFRIRAARTLSDRDENVFLEQVSISMPREQGEYLIDGNKARFNRETESALIEGDVRVRGPGDAELEADWLQVVAGGNVLKVSKGARFRLGQSLVGTARTLRVHLEERLVQAEGGVRVDSTPQAEFPMSLRADRILYNERARWLRAEGGVSVERDQDSLMAERITVRFDDVTNALRHVRALWQVRGVVVPPVDEGLPRQRLAFSGWGLTVMFELEPQRPQSLELEGRLRRQAMLISRDELGAERQLEGRMLTASFREGFLKHADALGPMSLVETVPSETGTLRRAARALGAEASFDSAGNLVRVDLAGEVVLEQEGLDARGDTAVASRVDGRSELFGKPARVATAQGQVQSPHILYNEKTGIVHALDGVRTQLEPGVGKQVAAMPFGGDDQPVRIESREAFLRPEPSEEFVFTGGVRAWQGSNLLFADQLRGNQVTRELAASGAVKTILRPPPEDEPAEAKSDAGDVPTANGDVAQAERHQDDGEPAADRDPMFDQELARAPIEITAELMTYAEGAQTVRYQGGVVAQQAGRTLSCQEMEIELVEGRAERLRCSGETRLVDPAMGRTIEGARAVYHLAAEEVEFFGSPLTIVDPVRGRIQGPELWYRLSDGSYRMGRRQVESGAASSP